MASLTTIVYASRAAAPMSDAALMRLLTQARARNQASEITGMLLFAYESFMQQLEGPEASIDAVYESIERDPRHTNIRLLSRRPVAERKFPEWSMGFEHPDADRLQSSLSGYRPAVSHPLLSTELVHDSGTAESLLELFATER